MPIVTELIVSVVGGVLTAIILGMFSRGSRAGRAAVNVPARAPRPERRSSVIGGFFRLIVSVAGGVLIAMLVGRVLIQAGILPRGIGVRLVLLVIGTTMIWFFLSAGRRR